MKPHAAKVCRLEKTSGAGAHEARSTGMGTSMQNHSMPIGNTHSSLVVRWKREDTSHRSQQWLLESG